MLFIIVFQYDYRYCIDQTTNVRFCGFDSLHPKGNQSRLQIIENPTFYSLRIELRFRTTARDIPPFLPQHLGLEWTLLDLSGLEPQAPNAVISTNQSNIKDPGICLRSPIYGAGEGNRTLDVSLGSSSFAIKLHPHYSGTSVPPFEYTAKVMFCQFLFLRCYEFCVYSADCLFEVCAFYADYYIDLARALVEHAYIDSV